MLIAYRAVKGCANAPSNNHGILDTMYVDTVAYALQRYTTLEASPKLWIRTKLEGTWGAWVEK